MEYERPIINGVLCSHADLCREHGGHARYTIRGQEPHGAQHVPQLDPGMNVHLCRASKLSEWVLYHSV